MNPNSLNYSIGNNSIFSFNRRLGNSGLLLGVPGNEIRPKANDIACSGAVSILAAGPISIKICNNQGDRGSRMQRKPICGGPLQVPENQLNSMHASSIGSMHKLGNYMNCKRNIRFYNGQILQSTYMLLCSKGSASNSPSVRHKEVLEREGL